MSMSAGFVRITCAHFVPAMLNAFDALVAVNACIAVRSSIEANGT